MSKRVIICGGGAIGAATAYFLSTFDAEAVVIERHEVGGAASGKSGGFLAYDWCRGTALDRLARRSFTLHAELAEELGNPWLYQRLRTVSGHARAGEQLTVAGEIGTPETTAVVEPRGYTTGLLAAAQDRGAELVTGAVADLVRNKGGAVTGVRLESGETVEGDAVVIALGPWSLLACKWLNGGLSLPAVYGVKGHSLVFDTGAGTPDEALFLEYQEESGEVLTPEIFPRANGTVWACAISSQPGLPIDPARVAGDAGAHARLEAICRGVLPALAEAPVVARQACFRPVTEDGLPLIGAVTGAPGAYVATGHSVWGMLNSPATGEALAELILDGGARHVDLKRFDPARLPALDPAALQQR
jgi:glycine/D-amino acid oxidase-like deaminating enzyme